MNKYLQASIKLTTFLLLFFLTNPASPSNDFITEDNHGNPNLKTLIQAPLERLGQSRDGIIQQLGDPLKTDVEMFPNRHDPSITDYYYYLEYNGIEIVIVHTGFDKEIVARVVLEKDFPELTLGIRQGNSQTQVKAFLPHPYRESKEILEYWYEYEEGPDIIRFYFKDEALIKIIWDYFID